MINTPTLDALAYGNYPMLAMLLFLKTLAETQDSAEIVKFLERLDMEAARG